MKNFKNLALAVLAVGALTLTGCLHIIEEVTFKNSGAGTYKMTIDMSEMKGMMDMFKNMGDEMQDSTGDEQTPEEEAPVVQSDEEAGGEDNSMAQMGAELSAVAESLKGVSGLTNVKEINDTTSFIFGYSFDFADVAALNKAMKIINKEKYDSKVEEVFRFKGSNFERLSSANLGEQIKKTLADAEEEDDSGSMDMIKTFFADMTYKQVYNFPDAKVKKSSNSLSEVSNDGKTLTITLKPFDEEQQKKKATVATAVKLK